MNFDIATARGGLTYDSVPGRPAYQDSRLAYDLQAVSDTRYELGEARRALRKLKRKSSIARCEAEIARLEKKLEMLEAAK